MVSKFALFCNILLASAVLAFPSYQPEAHFPPRLEGQSRPVNSAGLFARNDTESTAAGAIFMLRSDGSNGNLTTVTGSLTLPVFWGGDSALYISVAIDAFTCPDIALQAGVTGTIQDGQASYNVWYTPEYSQVSTSPFYIIPGDNITITVTVESLSGSTAGTMTIMNRTTKQPAWALAVPVTPCLKDVSWTVGKLRDVPFANFSNVAITDVIVTGQSSGLPGQAPHKYTYDLASGVEIIEITQNGENSTSVGIGGGAVTIRNLLGSGSQ